MNTPLCFLLALACGFSSAFAQGKVRQVLSSHDFDIQSGSDPEINHADHLVSPRRAQPARHQASSAVPASIMAGTETLFEESDGFLEVEAELFHSQEKFEKRKWRLISARQVTSENPAPELSPDQARALATAGGNAYLQILPDTRRSHADPLIHGENFSEIPGEIGVLNYQVRINNPGRYYVWVRAFSTNSEDNGLHAGLNGAWPESGRRLQWCEGKNSWRWESKQRTRENHCGEPHKIFLDIPTPGIHTISFSMREDGFSFDKFILTNDRLFSRSAP